MTAEEQAIAAYEDAASRGFPNGDQIKLQMTIYTAKTASAMAAVAAEPYALVVESITYSDGTEATGVAPLPEQSPAQQDAVAPSSEEAEPVAPTETEGA